MEELVDVGRLFCLVQRCQNDADRFGQLGIGHVQAGHHEVLESILLDGDANFVGGLLLLGAGDAVLDCGGGILPRPEVDVPVRVQYGLLGIGDLHPDGPVKVADQVGIEPEQVGNDLAALGGAQIMRTGRRAQEQTAEIIDGGVGKVEQIQCVADGVQPLDVGLGGGSIESLGDEEGHEHGDQLFSALEGGMPPILAQGGNGRLHLDGDGTAALQAEEGIVEQFRDLEGLVDDAVLAIRAGGSGIGTALDQTMQVRFGEEAARAHEQEGLRGFGIGFDLLGGDGARSAGHDAGAKGRAEGALAGCLGGFLFHIHFISLHIHLLIFVVVVVILVRRGGHVLLVLDDLPQRAGQPREQPPGMAAVEIVRSDRPEEEGLPLPLGQVGGVGEEVGGLVCIAVIIILGGRRFVVTVGIAAKRALRARAELLPPPLLAVAVASGGTSAMVGVDFWHRK